MRKKRYYLLISCFILFLNCEKENSIFDPIKESFSFNGKITYLSFEGGFYGIISEDGERYDPINLPDEYQKEDLNVQVFAMVDHGQSFHMWGTMIKIYSIKKI
jgi:hypothetical protein